MIYAEWCLIQALLFVLPPIIAVCDYVTGNIASMIVADALLDVVIVLAVVRRKILAENSVASENR